MFGVPFKTKFLAAMQIFHLLGEFPANDNIGALSGFEDVPAANDNNENMGFAELGFATVGNAQDHDDDTPLEASEKENREELNFYDEEHQRRGFLAEEPLIYDT